VVYYDEDIRKNIRKGHLPKEIARLFYNAFASLNITKDLNLFDIKKLVTNSSTDYFRLRKGKYRAIFKIEDNDFYVLSIAKREEVYKKWQ
jgi:mRNA interferase RelE/StbE